MVFFSDSAKRPIRILLLIFLAPFIIYAVGYGMLLGYLYVKTEIAWRNDALALYAVVEEAKANIQADPDFVNPATEEFSPAYIPYEYYSYVTSEALYSRAYVVIDQDGTLDAFYGVPDCNLEYYSKYLDNHLIPVACVVSVMIIVPVAAVVGCIHIRRRKKREFEATIAAIQADSQSDGESG